MSMVGKTAVTKALEMVALKVANSVVQKAVESVDWTAVSLAGRMAAMTALGRVALKVLSSVVK